MINFLAGLFSGLIGSMGMGGGAVLMIYLSVFSDTAQTKSGGINLIFFIPIAIFSVVIYLFKKQIKIKPVLLTVSTGVVGAVLGVLAAQKIGDNFLSKIFGGFLLVLGITELLSKNRQNKK